MPWSQVYAPLGGIGVSALVAALPVVVLLALLAFWHVRAHIAAVVALAGRRRHRGRRLRHAGARSRVAAAGYGAAFGLFPIGWIVLNAIFIYQLSVETGQFDVAAAADRRHLAATAASRRCCIAFCFGAFIEGAAGFGAPVAISGAMMIGLGFKPLEAAKLALIGNTAPVAFGSLGIPLITLAPLTGLDLHAAQRDGRPAAADLLAHRPVLARRGAGRLARHARGLAGVPRRRRHASAIVQFVVSNFHGPWLVDIVSAAVSMVALVGAAALLAAGRRDDQRRRPTPPRCRRGDRRVGHRSRLEGVAAVDLPHRSSCSSGACNPVKNQLNAWFAPQIPVPALHLAVQKMPPVAPVPTPEKAIFNFNCSPPPAPRCCSPASPRRSALGVGFRRALARSTARPVLRVRVSLLTISADDGARLHHALQRHRHDDGPRLRGHRRGCSRSSRRCSAGSASRSPAATPSSNVLFGNLQKVTAEQLGISPHAHVRRRTAPAA